MPRPTPTRILTNEDGDEQHESWAVVTVMRTTGTTTLFGSSIPHQHYVTLRVTAATRKRDLHTARNHPTLRPYIEIDLSAAQWADMLSSFGNGEGTPVTLAYLDGKPIPSAADDEPRLARTSREVADAARQATEQMREAADAVTAGHERKAGRAEMARLIGALNSAVARVPGSMKLAADVLTEHAEKVVSQTRADVDAATQLAARRWPAELPPQDVREVES